MRKRLELVFAVPLKSCFFNRMIIFVSGIFYLCISISYQSIGRSAFSYLHPLVWPTNDTQIRHTEIGCDIFICHVHSQVFICIDGMKKRAHPAEAQGSPLLELWAMRVICCRLFFQNPELQTISPMHFVFFQKCFLLSPELNSSLTSISAKPTLLFTTLKFIHSSYKN